MEFCKVISNTQLYPFYRKLTVVITSRLCTHAGKLK
jgi:hypothetical protein